MPTKKELKLLFDQIINDEFPELKERHVILILHDDNNKSEFWSYDFTVLAGCNLHKLSNGNPYFDPIVFINSSALWAFDKNSFKQIIRHELLHLEMNRGHSFEFWEQCNKRNIKITLSGCIENNKVFLNKELLIERFYFAPLLGFCNPGLLIKSQEIFDEILNTDKKI